MWTAGELQRLGGRLGNIGAGLELMEEEVTDLKSKRRELNQGTEGN